MTTLRSGGSSSLSPLRRTITADDARPTAITPQTIRTWTITADERGRSLGPGRFSSAPRGIVKGAALRRGEREHLGAGETARPRRRCDRCETLGRAWGPGSGGE